MKELLNINIDNLSKEELRKLKDEINDFIKPYSNKTTEIYNKIRKIEKEEYLSNRGVKNYSVLKELINEIGDAYKDVIVDLDESLGNKRYSSIRIYNEVEKACNNYGINFTYELADMVTDFLINNNIIKQQYEIYCSRCDNRITVFSSNPKSDTFIEDLFEEMHGFLIDIEEKEICCDECQEYMDLTDECNIGQSDFYKIIREE